MCQIIFFFFFMQSNLTLTRTQIPGKKSTEKTIIVNNYMNDDTKIVGRIPNT